MRILIADNQSQVRRAVGVLLMQQPGFVIVGEAEDTQELLTRAEVCQPDVLLLHWRLRGQAMAELLPALHKQCPDLRVVALSGRPELCAEALAAGAQAFVSKVDRPEKLLAALRGLGDALGSEPILSLERELALAG